MIMHDAPGDSVICPTFFSHKVSNQNIKVWEASYNGSDHLHASPLTVLLSPGSVAITSKGAMENSSLPVEEFPQVCVRQSITRRESRRSSRWAWKLEFSGCVWCFQTYTTGTEFSPTADVNIDKISVRVSFSYQIRWGKGVSQGRGYGVIYYTRSGPHQWDRVVTHSLQEFHVIVPLKGSISSDGSQITSILGQAVCYLWVEREKLAYLML